MSPIRYLTILLIFLPVLAAAQRTTSGQLETTNAMVPVSITFQTNPAGLKVVVDGTTYTTPYSVSWTSQTNHTINTTSPQTAGVDTQYIFSSWSDGGSQSHTVTAPNRGKTYTANFATQFYLTMTASPVAGGSVTPSSGWRNRGQVVSINATAVGGYSFSSWTGTGAGSYSGTSKAAQITMNGPIREAGNFVVSTQPVLSVQPSDRAVSSNAGTTTFTVSNSGTGTMNWTAISNQIWAIISSGSSGTNSGSITVDYAANPSSTDSRVASLTVTALGTTGSPQVVTITQAPSSEAPLITDTTSMSDDFRGTTLNTGLWTFVNPKGDATLSEANDVLTIAVPGGTEHQPWTSGNSAPRILQTVDPLENVAGWVARFNSVPAGSDTSIPLEGMLFEQDTANYLRVDIFSDGSSVYGFAAGFTNGPDSPHVYISTPIPVPGPPVWLAVTREGTQWRVYYSLDGQTVFTLTTWDRALTLHRVGVHAGNAGSAPQAFNCRLDYFQAALPAKAYLSNPADKAADVTSPVSFVWQPSAGASSYRLQVATDSNFVVSTLDSLVTQNLFTSDAPQATGQSYWWRVSSRSMFGWGPVSDKRSFSIHSTTVKQDEPLSDKFSLEQNYPNPFNPATTIKYSVGRTGGGKAGAGGLGLGSRVKLAVYDLLGREVAVLVNEQKAPGRYEATFDGRNMASGIYIYRLNTGSYVESRKMVLMK